MSKFMSKFFVQGNASSDSQDNEIQEGANKKKEDPHYTYDDDDRSEDKNRVVLTEKEKKWAEFKKTIATITNAMNTLDYDKVWQKFQELLKSVEQSHKLIDKEGHPGFLLKFIIKIEQDVNNLDSQQKKKLNKNSKVAYNTMRQKLKNKIMLEYSTFIEKFKEQGEPADTDQQFKKQQSSSEESQDDDRDLLKSDDPMVRRRYWLKKNANKLKESDDEDKKEQAHKKDKQQEKKKPDKPTTDQTKKPRFHEKKKVQKKKVQNVDSQQAEAQIKKLIKDFYKLRTQQEREDYLNILNGIRDSSRSKKYADFQKLSIRLVDIPMRVQVSRQMRLTHFIRQQWLEMFQQIEEVFQILRETEDEEILDNILQFAENQEQEKIKTTQQSIYNQLKAFIIILESQIKKAFMFIDNSQIQYCERLQDLIKLVDFMYRLSNQMAQNEELEKSATELSLKVIENMHFMSIDFLNKIEEEMGKNIQFTKLKNQDHLSTFCDPIYKFETPENITKLILYLVYNHAINYRTKAKDLLNMSNIPHIINKADYFTQALYNRAVVSIGICSFRNGQLHEVQQFLSEICCYAKMKQQPKDIIREFLAQGPRITGTEVPKNKLLPYYLHLNCELIECIELISSMILEVPYILNEGGRITSKTFRKLISDYERSYFVAQPIKSKDLIYAASNCLKTARWKQCYERLMELSIWRGMNDFETVKANLLSNIKQQSLKCYMVGNRKCFTSISLDGLALKFEIPIQTVRKLVCKWLYNKDLKGSITSEGYLQLVQKKQSDMQKVNEQLFNKLQDIMKMNENIFENRLGAFIEDDEEKEVKFQRKTNLAMTQKLKATLSKRS